MLIARGDAVLSECGTYRPWLTRELGGTRPLVSIGANPSTADADVDDATIRTEQIFAHIWGCNRLIKVNVYAYRATLPKDMWAAHTAGVDIVGEDIRGLHNDAYIQRAIREVHLQKGVLLFAWGKIPNDGKKRTGYDRVAEMLEKCRSYPWWGEITPMCIGINKDGSPKHPLYQPHDVELVPWAA